jgi:hypothetical protein
MAGNDSVRDLIDKIVACDDQPSEAQMTELCKSLAGKVATMKHRARHSRIALLVGLILFVGGCVPILLWGPGHQLFAWLTVTGFCVAAVGAVGLFLFHGFGYVVAQNDLHDAAIMELSLQVRRLAERIDAPKQSS